MRGRLVVGNWKSNGGLAANQQLLAQLRSGIADLKGVKCAVCVPYPYLFQAQQLLAGCALAWGAQDASQFGAGAYTGAVTAAMLRDFGCRYAIVGHSERRGYFGESNATVAAKFNAVIGAGLTPIACVGETLQERDSGKMEHVVGAQIDALIGAAGVAALAGAVVAYEPVWAIGTGKTATPDQAQSVHAFIRQRIAGHDAAVASGIEILYGGSVKAANAAELFSMPDIDGGLIGGAALVADDFMAICRAAQCR
jgi:triosephosphate isomerase